MHQRHINLMEKAEKVTNLGKAAASAARQVDYLAQFKLPHLEFWQDLQSKLEQAMEMI